MFNCKKNEEIIQIKNKDFTQSFYLKANHSFIIITCGRSDIPGYDDIPDSIFAYDISTKKLLWTTISAAGRYELSPDGKYLLTCGSSAEIPGSKFEIDGSRFHTNIEYNTYLATWMDIENILIATNRRTKNKILNQENKSKKDFESGKPRKLSVDELIPLSVETLKLEIFNVSNNQIANWKNVKSLDGQNIYVSGVASVHKEIFINEDGSIDIKGTKKGVDRIENYLFQINDKIEIETETNINNEGGFIPIRNNGKYQFYFRKNNKLKKVNKNTGILELVTDSELKSFQLLNKIRTKEIKTFYDRRIIFDYETSELTVD